jgi:hypothetical protein
LFFRMLSLALPQAASRNEAQVFGLAGRANRAILKYACLEELEATLWVSKVGDGLLEGFRFGNHEPKLAE